MYIIYVNVTYIILASQDYCLKDAEGFACLG